MRRLIILAAFLFFAPKCFAGFTEIGLTANYRRSAIDNNNYQESISYTTSVSYYFWENSALELSYTDGYSLLSVKSSDAAEKRTTNETNFDLTGLDLVLSLASRQAPLQPYVKIGGAYMEKEVFRQNEGDAKESIARQVGLVPSGGLGFKIGLTHTLALKFGVDAWTSPLTVKPLIVDYAGRAGFSWMF